LEVKKREYQARAESWLARVKRVQERLDELAAPKPLKPRKIPVTHHGPFVVVQPSNNGGPTLIYDRRVSGFRPVEADERDKRLLPAYVYPNVAERLRGRFPGAIVLTADAFLEGERGKNQE
jgi:hypothetical protein